MLSVSYSFKSSSYWLEAFENKSVSCLVDRGCNNLSKCVCVCVCVYFSSLDSGDKIVLSHT
jgi:hypothetical protein